MKEPKIISYNGKNVIYLDFSNLKKVEHITELNDGARSFIQKQPINSTLVLTNVENMYFNNELRNLFIQTARVNSPYIKASVIIGLYGLISFIFNDFLKQSGRNIKLFKTQEEALEYLTSF